MILGTAFAKADRAYYSSSLIVVTGLILTQLVFFSASRGFVLMRQKKGLFLSVYTGAGVPLTQFIVVTSMLVFSKLNLKKLYLPNKTY